MRVAKLYLLPKEQGLTRKLKQLLLGYKIDRTYSKEAILTLYLNKIYFGNNAYGVASAAKTYFHKSVKALRLTEAATLVGLIEKPVNTEAGIKKNRDKVLKTLLDLGIINHDEYKTAVSEALYPYQLLPRGQIWLLFDNS